MNMWIRTRLYGSLL